MPTFSANPFATDAWHGLVDVAADPGVRGIGEHVASLLVHGAPLLAALAVLGTLHAVAELLYALRVKSRRALPSTPEDVS